MSAAAKKKGAPSKDEKLEFRSPAEFFASNQNIAGFDNVRDTLSCSARASAPWRGPDGLPCPPHPAPPPPPSQPGKALYTTIREFVENSIDAAESAGRLPDVTLTVEEMDTPTFARLRGLPGAGAKRSGGARRVGDDESDSSEGGGGAGAGGARRDTQAYFRVTCRDNGCGIDDTRIADSLGRVLAGSKYGVRQTRGKFGLGAKMALIWAKKSTGLPIEVKTAHGAPARGGGGGGGGGAGADFSSSQGLSESQGGGAASSSVLPSTTSSGGPLPPPLLAGVSTASVRPPARLSRVVLDIDIHKNEPRVISHTCVANSEGWVGTSISVVISGAWSAYRSRVCQYFQQLAVITPYANLDLRYVNISGGDGRGVAGDGGGGARAGGAREFTLSFARRSLQIPRPPVEVKHHPSAVNDLLVAQLAEAAAARAAAAGTSPPSLSAFLAAEFQCIDRPRAASVAGAISGVGATTPVTSLSSLHFHAITRALVSSDFPPPSAACLSPAGEYNLRLGIMKELRPDMVATHTAPVGVFEGHPFIIEAGIALGGQGVEGLSVFRFANRIPLLFEGGSDVATQSAKRLAWPTYKIDPNRDKIGVFVSLVSTRVPFKGTGKEYIGDDIQEIREMVARALQACAGQLRIKLARAAAQRARADRKKNLVKYVPDAVRAFTLALKSMAAHRGADYDALAEAGGLRKRPRVVIDVVAKHAAGEATEAAFTSALHVAIDREDMDAALEDAATASAGLVGAAAVDADATGRAVFFSPAGVAVFRDAPVFKNDAAAFVFLPGLLGRA